MRTKRSVVWAASGVATLAFVGGCAAQQIHRLEPKLELRAVAQDLAGERQAGLTFSLTGSADDLVAGLKPSEADIETLRKLFDSSVKVAYDRGGDGVQDDRMLVSATIDGVAGTEVRLVDGTLYAKAPVIELAEKFGVGDVAAVREEAAGTVPALGTFFDGEWVSVDVNDVTDLDQLGTGLPTSAADARKAVAELEKSASNLFDGADVTRDPADSKHLIVTTSTAKAYAEMKRLVTAVNGDLGNEIADTSEDRPIVLDVWADNGNLSAVELNILQFADDATGRVAVRAEVTTGTPIESPSGASKIDLSALAGLVGTATEAPTSDAGADGFSGTSPETAIPGGTGAAAQAGILGAKAQALAAIDGTDPVDYLEKVVAETNGFTARIVRSGVAEVTVDGSSACVTVTTDYDAQPTVKEGAC